MSLFDMPKSSPFPVISGEVTNLLSPPLPGLPGSITFPPEIPAIGKTATKRSTPASRSSLNKSSPKGTIPTSRSTAPKSSPTTESDSPIKKKPGRPGRPTRPKSVTIDLPVPETIIIDAPRDSASSLAPVFTSDITMNMLNQDEFIKFGYTPLHRVKTKEKTKYVIAYNSNGQKVYVDTEGTDVDPKRDDVYLMETKSPLRDVAPSLKAGTYDCAKKDITGVALECKEGLCIIVGSKTDIKPVEINYNYSGQEERDRDYIAYPVVSWAEIRENPGIVLKNTDIVVRRLRKNDYETAKNNLVQLKQSIESWTIALSEFEIINTESENKIRRTLEELEQINNLYNDNPPTTDDTKATYRLLKYNLEQRNDGRVALIKSLRKISEKRGQIQAFTEEVKKLTEFEKAAFANMDYVIASKE